MVSCLYHEENLTSDRKSSLCTVHQRIAPVIKAVCSSPQAIFNGTSFLSQNLLGTLSANLLFPKVKTAPDSVDKHEQNRLKKDNYISTNVDMCAIYHF